SPGNCTVSIQTFFAYALNFGTEIKRCVRIDEQQWITVRCMRRCYRKTIRAFWFFRFCRLFDLHLRNSFVFIESTEIAKTNICKITAYAPFTEKQWIPVVKLMKQFRMNVFVSEKKI